MVDSEIIAPGSGEQGFEGRHYCRSMLLHKEVFAAIVQTKVESLTINIDPLLLSKLKKLQTPPSPVLVEKIMKLDAFKDIKQHIVLTMGTESQMTVKYLKDVKDLQ